MSNFGVSTYLEKFVIIAVIIIIEKWTHGN